MRFRSISQKPLPAAISCTSVNLRTKSRTPSAKIVFDVFRNGTLTYALIVPPDPDRNVPVVPDDAFPGRDGDFLCMYTCADQSNGQ